MPKHTSHTNPSNLAAVSSPSTAYPSSASVINNPNDSQNPSSPFYIHPSESPSMVLVTHVLTGNNYHSWSRSFKTALISKNKMGFLNGSIPIPVTTDPLFPSWERCNTVLVAELTLFLYCSECYLS